MPGGLSIRVFVMKSSVAKKIISKFALFLILVVIYGACVALANNMLRKCGYDSKVTFVLLVGSTIYVYYNLWKWLCRKLDSNK